METSQASLKLQNQNMGPIPDRSFLWQNMSMFLFALCYVSHNSSDDNHFELDGVLFLKT